MSYVPPEYELTAFNCPFCNAFAHQQRLFNLSGETTEGIMYELSSSNKYTVTQCQHCDQFAVWYLNNLVYPNATAAPLPEEDMPDEIKEDFKEARQVFPISSRSSAALLRLVIQKLCKHLGYSGENINDDIRKMVANGLDTLIQQAFDAVRVIGNESVHPGQIDLRDDPNTALQLFNLINFIIVEMITKPRRVQEIYSKLPQVKLKRIIERDKRSNPATHP